MSGLPNIQDNNEDILNNIQSLQQMEQQLFSSLETNPNLSADEQQKIVDKMNQLSNMRINLYKTLSGVNSYFQNALNTSVGSLKEQVIAIGIVESELNKAKKRLEILQEERNNKIRLVEINSYFGDKYSEHADLMKIVILVLIPVIFFTVLYNRGFLPNLVYLIIISIISLIGAYFFWSRFSSILIRDNLNYQAYNWPFNPSTAPKGSSSGTDPWGIDADGSLICIGDACCSTGMVYDTTTNKCIADTTGSSSSPSASVPSVADSSVISAVITPATETFSTLDEVNSVLTKKQQGKFKADYDLRHPNPYNINGF